MGSTGSIDSAVGRKELTPAKLASEVTNLVSLPEIYLKVRQLLDDPKSSLVDIANVVAVDPGLAGRVLRIANSAFCGFAFRIETIPRAMSMLGTQQIHDLVLATSVARSFSGIPKQLVDMARFWRSSVLCGASAKTIADTCNILDSERLFTAGLLAHVGRLALYLRLPEPTREAHAEAAQKSISLQKAIENKLGFDDADVAAELLSAWKLPDSLVEPVRHHTRFPCNEGPALEAAILHVASAIADMRDLRLDTDEMIRRLDETAWLTLKLNRDSLLALITDSESLASDITEQFLPERA